MNSASGVLFLFMILIHFGQSCGPAEIGQAYTITSTASVQWGQRVKWYSLISIQNEYFDCSEDLYDDSQIDPNVYPNEFVGTKTQLTITNVTKKDGDRTAIFFHNVNEVDAYHCPLPVYKRASSPTCQPVKLIGNNVTTSCTTAEVYPQAKCHFTLQNDRTDRRDIIDGTSFITYTHTDPKPEGDEYFSTSCTLQYPVDGLKSGNWTVQVSMYPDQINVSMAQGTLGQAAGTLMLSVPTVYIDSNKCPKGLAGEGDTNVRQGYIRQGARANCLCTRAHAGNPPGTIDWRSTLEGSFANLSQSANAVEIQIINPDIFTCQSTSVLDGSHSMTYTPKHAYGSSSASLTFQRPGPIYLCPNQQTNIDISCQVPANSFSPAALFTIRDGNSNNLVTKATGDTARSKSVNYIFTRPGQHTFTCRAENAVFGDIFSEAPAVAIQVYGPPTEPPGISAHSSQHGDVVMVGDDDTVTCDVSGGYPSVQSVTLTCGQDKSVTSNGTSAKLTLDKIQLTRPAINCTCQATHVTRCYNLKASTSIKVDVNHENKGPYTTVELAGTAICVFVGILILEAVISLIVYVIRREKAKRKNRNKDKEYDEIKRPPPQPYQNVREPDPNYLKINSSGQASVPSSETAKQKTERTYQNQGFGDDTEATEPDLNAYIYIEDE